jgi:signal peptide peptidase SppA
MATKRAHGIDRILGTVVLAPWAIEAAMLTTIAHVVARRMSGEVFAFDDFEREDPAPARTERGLAIIPMHGVLAPRMNALTDISGGTSFEQLRGQVNAAAADKTVRAIVLDIDSCGGSVLGATETADTIRKAREVKPVYAHANLTCASAAYWIAANATEVIASPSAQIGSVGVYSIHNDLSAALEQLGVKRTYVSAGKFKLDGVDGLPLNEAALARRQQQVDTCYETFIADLALGRGVPAATVRAGFGEGACLDAAAALAAGMIDRVEPIDATLARVLRDAAPSQPILAAASTPPPTDTPHEPSPATGHDRVRARRDLQRAILELQL